MSQVTHHAAHGQGYTCLAFSYDGKHCFTGGDDALVRFWDLEKGMDQEPEYAADAEQAITTIAVMHDCWLSGSKDGIVRQYGKERLSADGQVTSLDALQVNCVAIDPKGRRLAVASELSTLRLINLEDTDKAEAFGDFKRGVRKVTWHPTEPLLTASGSDGIVQIWDLSSQPKLEKSLDGIIPAVHNQDDPAYHHDCSVVWDHSGHRCFVASRTHEIVQILRSDWSRAPDKYSDSKLNGTITALAISPNGKYIASASQGTVLVWSTDTRRVISNKTHQLGDTAQTIVQLAFSPTENTLAWTDSSGGLTRWSKPVPDSYPNPVRKAAPQPTSAPAIAPADLDDFMNFADDIDDLDKNTVDEVEDVEYDDNFVLDDLAMDPSAGFQAGGNEYVKEMVSITKAQLPFQPGSTPLDSRLKKRYLAYNTIGVIEATDMEIRQTISVDCFDRSTRSSYNFTDNFKFDMGYLGERGALFACQPEGEHSARVQYKPFTSRSNEADWTYDLKRGAGTPKVHVLGIAAGGVPPLKSLRTSNDELQGFGNVIIATSEGDLTFLSGSGRERRIIGLGGDFLSMVAGVDWVFVVYRPGSTTIDGSQNLSYTLINFDDFSVRQRDILPVPKGHTLKWIGLTDGGAPAMYDSAGRLHVLTKYRMPHHALWTRLMDTTYLQRREGKDESYWPVGITGNTFMCLILKGRQDYPSFPRPLIQEIPIELPFRRDIPGEEKIERDLLYLDMSMEALEEELVNEDITSRERAMDKEFIPLIMEACKSANTARAIELAKLLHNMPSIDAAIKIAEFHHLPALKMSLSTLKAIREDEDDRHEVARAKRRHWNRTDAPPRRLPSSHDPLYRSTRDVSSMDTPQAVARPGLAKATPAAEKTKFTSAVEDDGWGEESVSEDLTLGSKRKRLEEEVTFTQQSEASTSSVLPSPKPAAPRGNPFARKAADQDNRNPFARKADSTNRVLKKSETFFDKVDAAEADGSKSKKPKQTKEIPKPVARQTTLFGLPPPKEAEKPKPGRPKKAAPVTDDSQAEIQPSATEDADGDTQMDDLVETQPAED